jgi:hypothetical protein
VLPGENRGGLAEYERAERHAFREPQEIAPEAVVEFWRGLS